MSSSSDIVVELSNWLNQTVGEDTLIYQVFISVFITLLAGYFWRRAWNSLDKQLKKTKNLWDDAAILALSRPVSFLILGVGGWVILKHLLGFDLKQSIRDIYLVLMVSWFIVRFIHLAETNLIESNSVKKPSDKIDRSTIEAISKLLRASVSITTFLLVLQNLGVTISAVLAFGGIGGIAIGFAAKDLLANFFGGLMIYLDRPFSIGDWIRSNDRNIEGTVEKIGWRQTRIRTFDKRPLYVPNAVFNNITVENPSRMTHRRFYETFGVRYDDINHVEKIVEDVKNMLLKHPEIETSQTMIVNVDEFADSTVNFFVYTFTKTTDWVKFHEIKQSLLLSIAAIVENNQSELGYPTQRLQIDDFEKLNNLEAK